TNALAELTLLRKIAPDNNFVKTQWMLLNLKTGHNKKVLALSIKKSAKFEEKLLYTDALALQDEWQRAENVVKNAELCADSITFKQQQATNIRQNKDQWNYYLSLVYKQQLFEPLIKNYYLQILAIKQAKIHERWQPFKSYSTKLMSESLDTHFFDAYVEITHYLGFQQKYEMGCWFLDNLSKQKIRKRYKQRLQEEKNWLRFLINSK